ncbi:MAG: hypothetical protein Q9162_003038 [Coniocarpon cinnabarinum]
MLLSKHDLSHHNIHATPAPAPKATPKAFCPVKVLVTPVGVAANGIVTVVDRSVKTVEPTIGAPEVAGKRPRDALPGVIDVITALPAAEEVKGTAPPAATVLVSPLASVVGVALAADGAVVDATGSGRPADGDTLETPLDTALDIALTTAPGCEGASELDAAADEEISEVVASDVDDSNEDIGKAVGPLVAGVLELDDSVLELDTTGADGVVTAALLGDEIDSALVDVELSVIAGDRTDAASTTVELVLVAGNRTDSATTTVELVDGARDPTGADALELEITGVVLGTAGMEGAAGDEILEADVVSLELVDTLTLEVLAGSEVELLGGSTEVELGGSTLEDGGSAEGSTLDDAGGSAAGSTLEDTAVVAGGSGAAASCGPALVGASVEVGSPNDDA